MRWSRTEYVCPRSQNRESAQRSQSRRSTVSYYYEANGIKEYELAEEEVKISLERFRDEYCNPDGSIK
jgi:hypothetical protein